MMRLGVDSRMLESKLRITINLGEIRAVKDYNYTCLIAFTAKYNWLKKNYFDEGITYKKQHI